MTDFCFDNKPLFSSRRPQIHQKHHSFQFGPKRQFPPTLRAPVLRPVRLHQLGEEAFQVLVLLLQEARGAGRAVEVRDFSRTEGLKFQIVEHDPRSDVVAAGRLLCLSPHR